MRLGEQLLKNHFPQAQIIPVRCDHTNDSEVEAVFRQISKEENRLDILVNNVWGGYENLVENGEFTWMQPFWK